VFQQVIPNYFVQSANTQIRKKCFAGSLRVYSVDVKQLVKDNKVLKNKVFAL